MPHRYTRCIKKVRAATKKRYGYKKYNEYAICSKLKGKRKHKKKK